MRAIVHYGVAKTGTSSLQDSFAHSAAALLDAGVLYPGVTSYPNHTMLLLAVIDPDEMSGAFGRRHPDTRERGRLEAEAAWEALGRQVAASGADTLLLSSEFVFGLRAASIERLIERLSRWCDDVAFVGYLRAPASHYLSALQQALKYGSAVTPLDAAMRYRPSWEKLARVAGGACRARSFAAADLEDGDVCTDFMAHFLGLDRAAMARVTILRSNESLSGEGMALLQAFNAVAFPGDRRPGNRLSKAAVRLVNAAEAGGGYTRPALWPAARQAIEHARREDADWARDTLGIRFPVAGEAATPPQEPIRRVPDLAEVVRFDAALLERLWREVFLGALADLPAAEAAPPPTTAEGRALLAWLAAPSAGAHALAGAIRKAEKAMAGSAGGEAAAVSPEALARFRTVVLVRLIGGLTRT